MGGLEVLRRGHECTYRVLANRLHEPGRLRRQQRLREYITAAVQPAHARNGEKTPSSRGREIGKLGDCLFVLGEMAGGPLKFSGEAGP